MKKVLLILLTLLMILPLFVSAQDYTAAKVVLDGEELIFDQSAIIVNSRTLVPLRKIFESFGAYVLWDGETKTVTAKKGITTIMLQIGSNRIYKITPEGEDYFEIDVSAMLLNGRTLVPVRAISEALEAEVLWDGATSTVTIENKNKNIKDYFMAHNNMYLPDDNTEVDLYNMLIGYPQIEGYDKVNESIKKVFEEKFDKVKARKEKEAKADYDGSLEFGWMFMPHNYELLTEVTSISDGKITLTLYETDYAGALSPEKQKITYTFNADTGEIIK